MSRADWKPPQGWEILPIINQGVADAVRAAGFPLVTREVKAHYCFDAHYAPRQVYLDHLGWTATKGRRKQTPAAELKVICDAWSRSKALSSAGTSSPMAAPGQPPPAQTRTSTPPERPPDGTPEPSASRSS